VELLVLPSPVPDVVEAVPEAGTEADPPPKEVVGFVLEEDVDDVDDLDGSALDEIVLDDNVPASAVEDVPGAEVSGKGGMVLCLTGVCEP